MMLAPLAMALALGLQAEDAKVTSPAARPLVSQAVGALLQAEGRQALDLIQPVSLDDLSERDYRMATCFPARLTGQLLDDPVHEDAGIDQKALQLYRAYWREALMAPSDREALEARLIRQLAELIGQPELTDPGTVGEAVLQRIREDGHYALGGRTGRLLDLMLWEDQQDRTHAVALPEGPHEVKVFYLDGFTSRGWSHYVTCGRASTGGWAKPEGLYVIVPGYSSLEDEDFAVNFLAHETQHFADYAKFPDLEGPDLEFRAKLTELVLADETREKVLKGFIANQGDDRADSHSWANRQVLRAVMGRLGLNTEAELLTHDAAALKAAAEAELRADSASRLKGA